MVNTFDPYSPSGRAGARPYRTYFLTARIKDELCRFHW